MAQAYRAELAKGLRAIADDSAYEQLMAEGCLAWAVVRASRLRLIASPDQSTSQMVRRRTQIVHTLTAATETAKPTGVFPTLTDWFDNLVEVMKAGGTRLDSNRASSRPSPPPDHNFSSRGSVEPSSRAGEGTIVDEPSRGLVRGRR